MRPHLGATIRVVAAMALAAGVVTKADAQVLFRPIIGGISNSGFDAGFELLRYRTLGPFDARAQFIGSVRRYEHVELSLESPPPATHDFFSDIRLRYRNYPQEGFWGLGPDTTEDAQTNYRLEDVWLTGTAGLHFRSGLRLAAIVGRIEANVGPGQDPGVPSTETVFSLSDAPGLAASPDYWRGGAEVSLDRRDTRDDTRSGYLATFEWTRFADDDPGDYSFDRFRLEYRHFFPLSDTRRIAARARLLFTDAVAGHVVPFYMHPSVGGSDTLRGYDHYRFRSNDSVVFNLEYRQGFLEILDLIVFADAGRVAETTSDLGLTDLHGSAGVGGRIRLGERVLFGGDLGFGPEGIQLWFRSSHTF
jgi:hypothetical protein